MYNILIAYGTLFYSGYNVTSFIMVNLKQNNINYFYTLSKK